MYGIWVWDLPSTDKKAPECECKKHVQFIYYFWNIYSSSMVLLPGQSNISKDPFTKPTSIVVN